MLPGKLSIIELLSRTFKSCLTYKLVAFYGLEVPCGDVITPAVADFPATVSINEQSLPSSAF